MRFSWDAFLARYGPLARLIARPLARPPATADDLVQEALLALHEALTREPGCFADEEHARNYFLRALRNQAGKVLRRAGREQPLGDELAADDPDALQLRLVRERHELVARCLDELAAPDRELLTRRLLEGHTLQRIADERGVPRSTLHEREQALLAQLRQRCARLENRPEAAR